VQYLRNLLAFGGILVEGFDLASVNRGSFYISLLSGAPFPSPSRLT